MSVPRPYAKYSSGGFTLVEIIVSAVILSIFTMAGLAAGSLSIASLNLGRSRTEALQGIQIDLEKIRQSSIDFCKTSSGYGTDSSSSISGCTPTVFATACDRSQTNQLGYYFQQYLQNNLGQSLPPYTAPSGKTYTITRTITPSIGIDGSSSDSTGSGRTVTIQYQVQPTGSNLILNLTMLTVTPIAAGSCPIQYVAS